MTDGTQAGAQAWWKTIVPNGKVPANMLVAGPQVIHSGDGAYLFAGHTATDGSGYGNISWNETDPTTNIPKSQQLYVSWSVDGTTAGGAGSDSPDPTPVDPGQVTPVQPLGDFSWAAGLASFLAALTDKALWVRIGEGALAVLILGIGFYLLLKREGLVNAPSA